MRLKNVSIKGFKSFADSTSLHFGEDVTGIVGPNGSGKSNIVDAIRWVLGEMKNKELRLEKMNDVIFNGTKKRKRSGAAKVTLTFENTKNLIPTEYHSVSVSRLLYQNGDSEYRLNDVTCRRKDIINLFVDTGIGSNSYAIIGQGNISQVVEGGEGSRRKMIEQAAGISKYKARKREATLKLNATDADLSRVEDLLFELERNLKDLERQAKRARKYREIKVKYKEKSIDLAVVSTHKFKQEYHELKEKITAEKEHLTKLRAQMHSTEAEVENLKKSHVDLEQTVSSSQKNMNHLLDELRRKESSREIKKQRLQFLREDVERLRKQIEEASVKLEQNTKDLEEADRQRTEVQTQKEVKEIEAEKVQTAYNNLRQQHESARSDMSDFLQNKQNLSTSVFNLEKGIAVNRNKIEGHLFTSEKMESQIQDAQKEHEVLSRDVSQYESEKQQLQQTIDELRSSQEKREAAIADNQENLEQLNRQIAQVQRDLDRKTNERDLIQNMVDNLEGFPESVRFLSANWSGEKTLLSDIIDCPPQYRPAIEAFLEGYLNHFIVDDLKEAMKALQLLNQSQKGKAQFFLLNEIDNLDREQQLSPPQNSVKALDILNVAQRYQTIMEHLLQNVFITEDMDVLRNYSGNGVVLHADGGTIRQKAQLKGGSVGLFQGKKLGRKKELEHLQNDVEKLSAQLTDLTKDRIAAEERLTALRKERSVEQLKSKEVLFNQVNEKYLTASTRLEGVKAHVIQTTSAREELVSEIEDLTRQNSELVAKLEQEKSRLDGLEVEIESRGGEVDQWVGKISLAAEELNRANKELMLVDNQEKALIQRIDYLSDQYETNEKTVQQGGLRLKDEEEEQRRLEKELNILEEQLSEEYKQKGEIQGALNEIEQKYFEERKKIVEKEEALKEVNRRIRQHQENLEKDTQRYTDVRIQLRSITDRMEVEFGITLKEIMDSGDEVTEDYDALETEVMKLRKRIENFGEINPMALEAYEEMKLRYDSIQQQKTDILDAKESLQATIKEIEDQATAKFFEAFEQVKVHFKDVFRTLFTAEDDCDLILTTPDDPLNSAIEVVARPKGKRPRTLTQLSGGEKAMTAIALLFALYLLKPAPFCIFDEVDAPFDDMNVSKFNKIMRRFAEHSQFVVITHNKLTMAKMDVLYGIFMQEPGVSAVSQVDFREFESVLS